MTWTHVALAHEPVVEAWARQQGEQALASLPQSSQRAIAFWQLDNLRFGEALRVLRRDQGVGGALQQHTELVSVISKLPAKKIAELGSNCTEVVRELGNMAPELGPVLRATAERTLNRLTTLEGTRFPVMFHVLAMVAYYQLGAPGSSVREAMKVLSYPRYGEHGNRDLFHAAFVTYTRRFLAKHPELGLELDEETAGYDVPKLEWEPGV